VYRGLKGSVCKKESEGKVHSVWRPGKRNERPYLNPVHGCGGEGMIDRESIAEGESLGD